MKTLIAVLMLGLICAVFLFGDNGFIAALITGTSTSDTALKGFIPVALPTSLIIWMLMRLRGKPPAGGG